MPKLTWKRFAFSPVLLLFCALGAPSLVSATTALEVINGATCIPYPPYQTTVGVPYQHWLYGFSQTAYCHLTMSDQWPVQNLSYVLFTGSTSGGVLTARLCVHAGDFSVTCGASKTISGGYGVNWVAPPSPMPTYASGAFVQFTMPSGQVSTIQELIPVWSK
jgi:hypothetical protein